MIFRDAATIVALSVIVPAGLFTLLYGIGSPWWKSGLGVILFSVAASVTLTFGLIISRRVFGPWPGYDIAALVVFSILALAWWAKVIILVIERKRADMVVLIGPRRKEQATMTTAQLEKPTGYQGGAPGEVAKLIAYIALAGAGAYQSLQDGNVNALGWVQVAVAILGAIAVYWTTADKHLKAVVAFALAAAQALAAILAGVTGLADVTIDNWISVAFAAFAAIGVNYVPNRPPLAVVEAVDGVYDISSLPADLVDDPAAAPAVTPVGDYYVEDDATPPGPDYSPEHRA